MNAAHPRARRAVLKSTPVAAAVALLVWSPGTVLAQTAPAAAPADQTVVVTGIRRAIETAITAKKEADTIVEAITSEDLGKLPDPSVADSIARLPGVAAQRNKGSGKAQAISVRGMSPDFNGGLLNGREVASSGDSRGVDFDLYPSELLNSVLVYKTPHASLLGQGLSSTIDLRTIRPLSASGRQIALNYRGQKTGIDNGVPNGEGEGDKMSFAYVDQFLNRTIGVAVGAVKFTETGAGQLRVNTWGGWTPTLDFNGAQVGVPGGFGRDIEYSDQTREGVMGVLQWKPNKNFETTLDIFQSKGRQANFKKGIEGFIGGGSGAENYRGAPQLVNATVANGFASSGTVNNFKGVIRNHNEGSDDDLKAWGLNANLKVDKWSLTGDLGQSKVIKESARFETTAGLPGNGNPTQRDGAPATPGATGTISWTGFNGTNHGDLVFTSSTNFADRSVVKLTDVMGWGGGINSPQAGYVASPRISDEIMNLRFSAKRDLGWGHLSSLEVGLASTEREKIANTQEGFLVVAGATGPFAAINVPGSTTQNVAGFEIATWDPRGSLGSIYNLRSNLYGTVINRNWAVKEDVTTAFVKGDLDGTLFGFPYTGNAGMQMVRTEQSSTGFVNDSGRCAGTTPGTCTTLSGGKTYTDVLPSVNLNVDVGSDMIARFGLGKTLSRPTMGQMRASMDPPSLPNPPLQPVQRIVSSGGNPELEPFRATALDISFEKYFSNKGYISVAGFYKDIDTYVLTLPTPFDFAGRLPANFVVPPAGTLGILTRPTNGTGGNISGVELAVNVPLSMIAKPLDGFGIAINHSDTRSSIVIGPGQLAGLNAGQSFNIPLPGLSRKVTNLRFYYEKHGFQIAVAQRTRSDFLGEIKDYKDDTEITFIKGETVVDLQLGYTFPDRSFLKGLSLLFQANNVTDALFQQYITDRNAPTDTKRYGKTYLFGANYKF
ncbi:MAG: TonB-dependent receptor [Rubrivivax sp.]|nr:TonB-dependent receptor [Rubrivivax sp.]